MDVTLDAPVVLVGPDRVLHYLEVCSTAASATNALAAAAVEGIGKWSLDAPALGDDPAWWGMDVTLPGQLRMRNTVLKLDAFSPPLHHLAIIGVDGGLLLARSDDELWHRLRQAMTCPTQASWGRVLVPRLKTAGVVQPVRAHGWPPDCQAWVLADDAQEKFDRAVSAHVRKHGLEER